MVSIHTITWQLSRDELVMLPMKSHCTQMTWPNATPDNNQLERIATVNTCHELVKSVMRKPQLELQVPISH